MSKHFSSGATSQDRIDAFVAQVRQQGVESTVEISDAVAEAARRSSRYPTPEEQLAAVVQVTRQALAAIDAERRSALDQITRILEEVPPHERHQNQTGIIDADFHERQQPVQSRNHPGT